MTSRRVKPRCCRLVLAHGFEALNRYVRSRGRQTSGRPLIVCIDEFYIMSTIKATESYVANATKTWRNYQAAMWTADQNATTYFKPGTEAAYTTNNTLLKFFFRQEGAEADVLGAAYRDYLGDDDIQTIKTAGVGECVALLGDEVHRLMIHPTDQEAGYVLQPTVNGEDHDATPT